MANKIDVHLPENLTIANVHGLHEQLESIVGEKDCDHVVLQGEDVQRADTAGLQLLLAFTNAAKEREMVLDWSAPSDKLCAAASLLGLDNALGIH